jgi:hypothetical protein
MVSGGGAGWAATDCANSTASVAALAAAFANFIMNSL